MIWSSIAKIFDTSRDSVALHESETPKKNFTRILFNPFCRNFVMTNDDGKQAIVDFSGDTVTYTGELNVDDAARLFFDKVGHLIRR